MITLGVIGVVAALTMPSLVAHYRGKVIKTQLKKSLSVVNQAVRAGMAKEGITESADVGDCFVYSGTPGVSNFNPLSLCNFFEQNANVNPPESHDYYDLVYSNIYKYGSKAYKELDQNVLNSSISAVKSIVSVGGFGSFLYCATAVYQLADGSIAGIPAYLSHSNCTLPKGQKLTDAYIRSSMAGCIGFVDVNGLKGPNKFAVCNNPEETNLTPSEPCEVGEGNIGDFYPIIFHDGIFEMATNAGAYVYNN